MDPEIYTIAWICAIKEEFVSACRMLDEELDGPDASNFRDSNTYAYGRVHDHHVVIGCLPAGQDGISSAAVLVKDMTWAFPNLRFALMVGIGGGAPTEDRDIRLGDVVVSMPQTQHGGVLQYDFLKKLDDGKHQRTGTMNPPPKSVRAALVKTKRLHDDLKRPDMILDHVKRMDDTPDYQRPQEDRLYRADCTHEKIGDSCENCGTTGMVERAERTVGRQVAVHYGTIASSDSVMSDAAERDAYSGDSELKILCFETEASGLKNNVPSLMIRGICDYSDSHRNTDWHKYAALVAAAYTRELLHVLKPSSINAMPPIKQSVKIRSEINSEISSFTRRKTEQMLQRRLTLVDDAMLEWITSVNYGSVHNYHVGRRQPGTGNWLSESPEFQTWLNDRSATLFCTGIAGAGKTVLSSCIIEHLQQEFRDDSSVGIAYIYCNFNKSSEQDLDHLFSSLLKQLSRKRTTLPEPIKKIYQQHNRDGSRPSWEEIWSALKDTARLYSKVFIVVDALDELDASSGTRFRFISRLLEFQDVVGVNIFATARDIAEMSMEFDGSPRLEIRTHDDDLRVYLEDRIAKSGSEILEAHGEELIPKIIEIADGIFLLARLLFNLAESNKSDSIDEFKHTLDCLPTGSKAYSYAYSETMRRIKNQEEGPRELAQQALSWVVNAKRPLKIRELQYALTVKPGTPRPNKFELPKVEDLVTACAGLVTVEEESSIIRLVHDTAKQYFDRNQTHFPDAERMISRVCTCYISDTIADYRKCRNDESVDEFWRLLELNPLFDYAVRYWGLHTRAASPLPQEVVDFLKSEKLREFAGMAMIIARATDYSWKVSFDVPAKVSIQHLAAFYGITKVLRANRKISSKPSAKDTWGRTPLLYAVMGKHQDEVVFLLDSERRSFRGALRSWAHAAPKGLNKADKRGSTPLTLAASAGDEGMVKQLTATRRVNLDCQDNNGQTPLINAARRGHLGVVKLLLATNKVNVNFQDDLGRTAVLFAAGLGYEDIVKVLLATNKVRLNLQDDSGNTPLILAARNGYEGIFKRMLAVDNVDMDHQDHGGHTALSHAMAQGHQGIVELFMASQKLDSPCPSP